MLELLEPAQAHRAQGSGMCLGVRAAGWVRDSPDVSPDKSDFVAED
jgi:hypothetical protein